MMMVIIIIALLAIQFAILVVAVQKKTVYLAIIL
jgi:hypothetical protein